MPTSPRARELAHLAVTAGVAALLSGFIPLMLVANVPDVGRSHAWKLTLAIMIWAGLRLSYRIVVGNPRLFDFVFWLFTYVFMGLGPTVQIRSGELSRTTSGINPDLDMITAGAVWAGIIAYELGHWLARRRLRSSGARAPVNSTDGIDPRRALVLAGVGFLAALYYVNAIGLSTLFMSRYSASAIRSEALPDPAFLSILTAAASYPLLIAAGAFIRLSMTTVPGPKRDLYRIAALVTVPVLLVIVNPFSSARYDFGTVGFALFVFVGAMATIKRARISMALTVVAFLFVFPLADAFRRDTVSIQRTGLFEEYAGNPDYDAFWQIANTLSYLSDVGVKAGDQFLGVILFWVPRSVWPAKPVDTGVLLAESRGYSFQNLSAPLWSELLVNGSWLLLVVGFVIVGYVLMRLDRRISWALLHNGRLWVIIGGVFPFYMVILLRGSLLQATGTLVVAVLSVLLIRSPSRAPAAATRGSRRSRARAADRMEPPARGGVPASAEPVSRWGRLPKIPSRRPPAPVAWGPNSPDRLSGRDTPPPGDR